MVSNQRFQSTLTSCSLLVVEERWLVGAVHVGSVQSPVAYAMHRLWTIPASEYNGRMVDNGQHANRSHVLRHVCRSCNNAHTVLRHVEKTVQGKGRPYPILPTVQGKGRPPTQRQKLLPSIDDASCVTRIAREQNNIYLLTLIPL